MLATSKEALNAAIEAANTATEDDLYGAFTRNLDPQMIVESGGLGDNTEMDLRVDHTEDSERVEYSNIRHGFAEGSSGI